MVLNHQLHIIDTHNEQVQTPTPDSFKSSQSNLCLIPSWPNFQNISQPKPSDEKTAHLFCPYSHTSMAIHFSQFFIHLRSVMMGENWREGIFPLEAFNLESSIILRTKGLGGKGRQSKGNLAAGAETGQHQSTHWFKVLPLSELNTNPNIESNFIALEYIYFIYFYCMYSTSSWPKSIINVKETASTFPVAQLNHVLSSLGKIYPWTKLNTIMHNQEQDPLVKIYDLWCSVPI